MTGKPASPSPPAVVLGGGWNGLGQVWALAQIAVKVFCVVTEGPVGFAARSRHARRVQSPNPVIEPSAALDMLLDLARRQGEKPVLLFTDDPWMFLVGEHEDHVRELYLIPQSRWGLMERILNKRTLYRLAREVGIDVPQTWEFTSISALLDAIGELPFPCIIKPEVTVGFLERLPAELRAETYHRTRRYARAEDLRRWGRAMVAGEMNIPVVVQEFIPGSAETLFTLTSYSDSTGRMVAGSVGHKVRQFPPDAGCIEVGRLRHVPAVFEQGGKLLDAAGFHGLANTEFKYDPRDGSYRLMEINPRLGKWNGSALAAGMNLPAIAYRDMLGERYHGPAYSTAADGALWISLWADAVNCLYRYRASGYPNDHLGLCEWLRSVRGRHIASSWKWDDPMPSIAYFLNMLAPMARHLAGRILRKGRPK